MRRVVLDANVLISALILPGLCRKIILSLENDRFIPVLSPTLLEDFLRAIEKPRLRSRVSSEYLEEIISLIHEKAIVVEPKNRVKVCRDPDDDAVIECAVAGKARLIVTGDKDLLVMKSYKEVKILSPRLFATKLKIC